MNKTFRYMAQMMVTALMWCGCQSGGDEPGGNPTPLPNEKAIAFSGDLTEKSVSRAGDVGLETYYKRFKVWGFKNDASSVHIVMNGYTVNWINNSANTTASNSSNWEYVNQQGLGGMEQSIKYWDFSAKAYRFFGVAGASETNSSSGAYKPSEANPERYEVTYVADAYNESTTPYYSHLWFSDGDDYGKPVQLEFIKPLSRVRFIFTFEDPNDARETELTGKTFTPGDGGTIKMKGKVTVTYPLTGSSEKESFAATAEAEGITGFTQESKIYTVLPTPSGQSNYTMTVSVNGDPKTTIVPAQYMTWLPGYLYTYIFKIHIDGSVTIDNVQSAFKPWIEHEKDDHTVYNW